MHKSSFILFLIISIISLSLILTISSFWNDSLIVDEIPHVGAGYSYLKKFDYRLNPEHPPLVKALATIPLLFLNLKQTAFQTKFWLQDINGQWDFGRFLIFQSGNDAELITKLVKFPVLIFFISSAILIFIWTKKLYGDFAGIIALIIFSLSPTIVAHSRFVTTDIASLWGVLFSTFYFLNYLNRGNKKDFYLVILLLGLALLTKFSTFLLIPFFFGLALIYSLIQKEVKKRIKLIFSTILILIFSFVLIVWPIYFLFTLNYPPEKQKNDTEFILTSFGNRKLAELNEFISDKPLIRALGQYMLGLLMVGQRATGGNTTYFLGEISAAGWKHYFPVVYALKEPLPLLILIIISLLYLAWQIPKIKIEKNMLDDKKLKIKKTILDFKFYFSNWVKINFFEFSMILWIGIYWVISIKSNLNIGVRHLLPTYPFIIILVSGQINRLLAKLKSKIEIAKKFALLYSGFYIFILGLLVWYIFENFRVWPYYLSYFNQIAGGPSGGYRYVVDSNLDWGQDLKRLKDWVEKNNIDKIYLDYFGWSDPAFYLEKKFQPIWVGKYRNSYEFIKNTGGGYLAVSATFYMGSREKIETSYAWLDDFKPITIIGNSIWVWKIDQINNRLNN